MSNKIDALLSRIEDPGLRAQVAAELSAAQNRRKFGLVFENHLPETVRLPRVKPRRGVKVALKGAPTGREDLLFIKRMRGIGAARVAECIPAHPQEGTLPEVLSHPVSDLVVVAEFGDPIYPGLTRVGEAIGPGTNPEAPSHIVLNAENHHALQALQWSHTGGVDLIYIDPPYNTGNKTWQYNDHYVAEKDTFRHSKWLSFMEKRLVLAKTLLKDTGAIMVSIGDDEQHHLRMLMDQVFGERNKVAQLAVEMSTTSGPKTTNAQQGTIVKNIEYVLIYRKSDAFDREISHTPLYDGNEKWDANYPLWLGEDGEIENLYQHLDSVPEIRADIVKLGLVGEKGKSKGKFIGARGMDRLLFGSDAAKEFIIGNLDRIARTDTPPVFARSLDVEPGTWQLHENEGRRYRITRSSGGKIWQIYTLEKNYRMSDDYSPRIGRTVIRGDLWRGFHSDMAHVSSEGGVLFANGKKPIRLISQLVKWANNSPDAVILDFFGGSGSTAHAVADMNAKDGGSRQAIIVTNNELPADVSSKLAKQGIQPGEPAYEEHGVFQAVTRKRLENVFSDGLPGRVEFFDLEYLDADRIADDRAFEAVLPMLWMRAGTLGQTVVPDPDAPWYISGNFAVLRDSTQSEAFAEALPEEVDYAYIVTNSAAEFARAIAPLPEDLETIRLYEKYLTTFEINTLERA